MRQIRAGGWGAFTAFRSGFAWVSGEPHY